MLQSVSVLLQEINKEDLEEFDLSKKIHPNEEELISS